MINMQEQEEQMDNEENLESQEMTIKTKEEIKEESIKKETSKLYAKLEEIQEKLENEDLTPIKRFLIETKLAIIQTRLERQLAKLDIREMKKNNEIKKDEMYETLNQELQQKQEEMDSISEEIEIQQRIVEGKLSNIKNRNIDYSEINDVGRKMTSRKNTRSIYQFSTTTKLDDVLQEQQDKLKELQAKKDLKKQEIINFEKNFFEDEKLADIEFSKSLKEHKPSIWQSIKIAFKRISDNFINWRKNSKEEKEAVKNAKAQARKNVRREKNINSITENAIKMEEFKDRVNSHISLEEQNKYSEKVQKNLGEDEETVEERLPDE